MAAETGAGGGDRLLARYACRNSSGGDVGAQQVRRSSSDGRAFPSRVLFQWSGSRTVETGAGTGTASGLRYGAVWP